MLKDLITNLPKKRITSVEELCKYEELLEEYLLLPYKKSDIANIFFCSEMILDEYVAIKYQSTFEEYQEVCKARGSNLVLSKQFESAVEDGNLKMLQFLGKNYLKQVDDGTKSMVSLNAEHITFVDSVTEENEDKVDFSGGLN